MLVARHGFGVAEIRLLSPTFAAAVRWALYAEKVAEGLPELRQAVATDPPDGMSGAARIQFIANRKLLRESLKRREEALYPDG